MTSSEMPDALVLGDGLVGVACAHRAAERGLRTVLVGRRRPGLASTAAAGILAPTVDPARGPAFDFMLAARDRYPAFVRALEERTARRIPFALDGVLRVPATEREARTLSSLASPLSQWLSPADVSSLERGLTAPLGARFHHGDGSVDNQRLLHALDEAAALAGVVRHAGDATRVELLGTAVAVALDSGQRIRARHVIVATGAWAPLLPGLPRRLGVRPLRGQMMALATCPMERPVFGFGGYVVPRPHDGEVLVGSTSEAVGFAVGTTDGALAGLREVAGKLVPALRRADEVRTWSGLRPMTLDALPIIGADPEHPGLLYACGHSRNGILLAPLTAEVIIGLLLGEAPAFDLSPFAVTRFSAGFLVGP